MSLTDWLANLRTGDTVIITSNYDQHTRTAIVERTTATQILVDGDKYRRKDGERVGGDFWSRPCLVEPTPELLNQIETRQRVQWLSRFPYDKLPLDALRRVGALVRQEILMASEAQKKEDPRG